MTTPLDTPSQEEGVYKTSANSSCSVAIVRDVIAVREALEFYANPSDYVAPYTGGLGNLYFDCGAKAKQGLAVLEAQLGQKMDLEAEMKKLLTFHGDDGYVSDMPPQYTTAVWACIELLRKAQLAREPVSIGDGAKAVKNVFDMSLVPPDSGFTPEDIAKACADAWGIPHDQQPTKEK